MKQIKRMISFFMVTAMAFLLMPTALADNTETGLPEEDEPILVLDEEAFTDIVTSLLQEYGRETDDFSGLSVGFCCTKTNEAAVY